MGERFKNNKKQSRQQQRKIKSLYQSPFLYFHASCSNSGSSLRRLSKIPDIISTNKKHSFFFFQTQAKPKVLDMMYSSLFVKIQILAAKRGTSEIFTQNEMLRVHVPQQCATATFNSEKQPVLRKDCRPKNILKKSKIHFRGRFCSRFDSISLKSAEVKLFRTIRGPFVALSVAFRSCIPRSPRTINDSTAAELGEGCLAEKHKKVKSWSSKARRNSSRKTRSFVVVKTFFSHLTFFSRQQFSTFALFRFVTRIFSAGSVMAKPEIREIIYIVGMNFFSKTNSSRKTTRQRVSSLYLENLALRSGDCVFGWFFSEKNVVKDKKYFSKSDQVREIDAHLVTKMTRKSCWILRFINLTFVTTVKFLKTLSLHPKKFQKLTLRNLWWHMCHQPAGF